MLFSLLRASKDGSSQQRVNKVTITPSVTAEKGPFVLAFALNMFPIEVPLNNLCYVRGIERKNRHALRACG